MKIQENILRRMLENRVNRKDPFHAAKRAKDLARILDRQTVRQQKGY